MKCNLRCEYLATVKDFDMGRSKIIYAYCRKYNCDLSCHGGIVRRKFKCKENAERKRRKNERLQSF